MQIRKLEEMLEVVLIERRKRNVTLTAAGKVIVAQARAVVGEHQRLKQLAAQYSDPMGGDLHLGVIPTIAPYFLPKAVPWIKHDFPNLQVNINECQTEVILRLLDSGDMDAAILALPTGENSLFEAPLYREPFLFTVNSQHKKANRKSVVLDDLKNEQVLLLDDGHCFRDQALEICNSHEAVANTNFRASSLETLREMVAVNVGVTLMPALAVRQDVNVRYIRFKPTQPFRQIGLVWRKTCPLTKLLQHLRNVLDDALQRDTTFEVFN